MYCPYCGTKNKDGATFCTECGKLITRGEPADSRADVGERFKTDSRTGLKHIDYKYDDENDANEKNGTIKLGKGGKHRYKKIIAVVAVIVCAGVFAGLHGHKSNQWQEYYDTGMKYLSEENYEEAIVAFTKAIKVDAKRADGYVKRGDAYTGRAEQMDSDSEKEKLYEAAVADYAQAEKMGNSEAKTKQKTVQRKLKSLQHGYIENGGFVAFDGEHYYTHGEKSETSETSDLYSETHDGPVYLNEECKIMRDDGVVLADDAIKGGKIAVSGNWIYYTTNYLNEDHTLPKNEDGEDEVWWFDGGPMTKTILARVKTDGSEKTRFPNCKADNFYIDGDEIFYVGGTWAEEADISLYRTDLDGKDSKKIVDRQNNRMVVTQICTDGDYVYFDQTVLSQTWEDAADWPDVGVWRVKKDGTALKQLVPGLMIDSFTINDNRIYYYGDYGYFVNKYEFSGFFNDPDYYETEARNEAVLGSCTLDGKTIKQRVLKYLGNHYETLIAFHGEIYAAISDYSRDYENDMDGTLCVIDPDDLEVKYLIDGDYNCSAGVGSNSFSIVGSRLYYYGNGEYDIDSGSYMELGEMTKEPVDFSESEEKTEQGIEYQERFDALNEKYKNKTLSTQSEVQEGAEEYDALLNDMYQYLKSTLPDAEFQELRKRELNWIEWKESQVEAFASGLKTSTSSDAETQAAEALYAYTQSRCQYFLINYF